MYTNNFNLEKKKSINFKFGYFPILIYRGLLLKEIKPV